MGIHHAYGRLDEQYAFEKWKIYSRFICPDFYPYRYQYNLDINNLEKFEPVV